VAIGGVPNAELGSLLGAAVLNGVHVNEFGETNVADVYATGDVANHPSRWAQDRIRLESWQVAQNHSVAVARSICGERIAYDEVPWFWSDQFGVNIQITGLPRDGDQVFYRGPTAPASAIAFYYRHRQLIGAIAINNGLSIRIAQQLIARGGPLDPAALVDPATSLKALLTK
jgi:3-phenylpropionate/trans-cinnamate dioxygenase ferredoxin reductase subunit